MCGLPVADYIMAHQIIIEISSDSLEYSEEDDVSSPDPSVVGSNSSEPSGS